MALVQGRRTQPSALDSPRFFDDAPLSAWRVGNNPSIAASKETFADAKAYTRAEVDDAPSPTIRSEGEPIPIEFVRGANGPDDDEWTIVVDGMRCQPTKLPDGSFVCTLPSGVPFDVITQDTRVRPVSIAVRLENEAELPLSAEAHVTQIIESSEREDNSSKESSEKAVGSRVAIQPYRTTDVTVKAVTMAYPFWAPSQSALGLLSLKPVNRHNEREGAARAYNLYASVRNAAESAAYSSRKRAYDSLRVPGAIAGGIRAATDHLAKLTNQVTVDIELTQADVDRYRTTLRPPKKARNVRPRLVRPRSAKGGNGESYIIGGKSKSVVAELTEMFVHMVNVCERMRTEAKAAYEGGSKEYKKLSLRAQLGAMRFALITDYEGDEETAALFDALLDVDPHPPAQFLLNLRSQVDTISGGKVFTYDNRKNLTSEFRREYIVNECEPTLTKEQEEDFEAFQRNLDAGAIGATAADLGNELPEPEVTRVPNLDLSAAADLPEEERKRLVEENTNYLKAENERLKRIADGEADSKDNTWGGKDYMFVYDRMTLEQRKQTTLRMRIHVHIVNFDGSELKVRFEANQEDGIVAHAVYSEYRKEIDEFDIAAQKLVKCLFDVHAQKRGVVSSAQDQVAEAFETVAEAVFGKYALQRERVRSPYFGSVFEILKYVTYDKAEGWTRWLVAGSPFKLDPCRVEERIAELRIMAREILPIWPPMEPPLPVAPVVPTAPPVVDPDLPAVSIGAILPDNEAYDDLQEFNEEQRKEKAEAQAQADIALQRMNASDPAAGKSFTAPPDEFSVIYNGYSTEEQETRIIVRELPQVVVPGAALTLTFLAYEFDEGLILVKPSQESWWRTGAWIAKAVGSAALWAAAATAGYLAYVGVFDTALAVVKGQLQNEYLASLFPTFLKAGATIVSNPFAGALVLMQDGNVRASFAELASGFLNPLEFEVTKGVSVNDWWDAWARNSGAVTFGANMATWTMSFANRKAELSKRYHDVYEKLQRKLVERPVNSAVVAARSAMKKMRAKTKELRTRSGVADKAAVVYNDYTGRRFGFYEYYENTDALVQRIEGLPRVHKGMEWAAVPDGGALRLFPPLDVADRMYEAEALRGMPIAKTISFTAGTPPALAATSPAELAAKAAHQEIMQLVRRARRLLRGQHLMQSAAALGLELVQNAAAILRASYGISAGITLVDGDDIIWTCLQGGVAARLALRHLSLFDAAESKLLPITGGGRVDKTLRFWRRPRRGVMDDFVKAFVDEAVYVARQERTEAPLVPALRDYSTDAVRSFARAKVLVMNKPGADDLEKTTLLSVVASSMAHGLLMNAPPIDDFYGAIANLVTVAEPAAESFDDQRDFELPKPSSYGSELNKATWASRRIAPSISRSIEVGGGALDIVEKLAALEVADSCGPKTTTRSYYCPMGGRTEAVPSATPFAIDVLGARIVWTEVLYHKAIVLTQAITEASSTTVPTPDGALFLDTVPLSVDTERMKKLRLKKEDNKALPREQLELERLEENAAAMLKLVGMARHPLVIQQAGSVIYVPTSFTSEPPSPAFSQSVPQSLLDTMQWLQTSESDDTPYIVRARVRHMRTVAFNAERFMFALALSRATAACAPRIEVRLRSVDQVASLALGLALLEVEMGSLPVEIGVYVDDVEAARSYAEAVAAQAYKALASNCRVCSLAEAALCL